MQVKRSAPGSVAAIDLGSNSFHMVVARVLPDGELRIVDRLKDMVRLAGGLDSENRLTDDAQARAIRTLQKFGERIRDFPPGSVRAVGTNTLRQARNIAPFLAGIHQALGHPVEIIAGREEARLVYLGVAHSLAGGDERRLVIDIGGGSTELIIGQGYEPILTESVYIGCVSASAAWFSDGRVTHDNWQRAVLAARVELEPIVKQYRNAGWGRAIGASGTIVTTERVLREGGMGSQITLAGLQQLRDRLIEAGDPSRLKLPGVSRERQPVFHGGVAVLQGVFEALGIERMEAASGALREGVLNDLVGRIRHEDIRLSAVHAFARRYHVDKGHAERVAQTAADFFMQAGEAWGLAEDEADHLNWAAHLHEIGLDVAHSEYHKHGAYLLEHADLPGFSRQDQQVLATLVRTHRRKFNRRLFEAVPHEIRERVMRLSILLRLAVVFNRSRSPDGLEERPLLDVRQDSQLALSLPASWRDGHPLVVADLENEQGFLRAAKFRLIVN